MPEVSVSRLAPAKINLTLHVTGQLANGYHLLDSLVVFAELGDRVSICDAPGLQFSMSGPQALALADEGDNLVVRAARLMGAQDVGLTLDKRLPVASGMGGGSSDAAAALHLLSERHGIPLPNTAQAMGLGADVPVCLAAPQPCRMRGLGEDVTPLTSVPALWMLLVNPGQGLSTPTVFKALKSKNKAPMPETLPRWVGSADFCAWLETQRNDLEAPARALIPGISTVLDKISAQDGCYLARMTGSGATCFGLFVDQAHAQAAAESLARPDWFVASTRSAASLS